MEQFMQTAPLGWWKVKDDLLQLISLPKGKDFLRMIMQNIYHDLPVSSNLVSNFKEYFDRQTHMTNNQLNNIIHGIQFLIILIKKDPNFSSYTSQQVEKMTGLAAEVCTILVSLSQEESNKVSPSETFVNGEIIDMDWKMYIAIRSKNKKKIHEAFVRMKLQLLKEDGNIAIEHLDLSMQEFEKLTSTTPSLAPTTKRSEETETTTNDITIIQA